MKTTLLAHVTARATATPWRWPPDRSATGAVDVLHADAEVGERLLVRRRIAAVVEEPELAEQAAAHQLAAQEQVGGGVEVGREREVLVDGLDAELARRERAGDRDRRPSKRISPPSGR